MIDYDELNFVMVPGLENSGPEHWQSRWQPVLGASRVIQRDWANPTDLDQWANGVVRHLECRPPAVLIAHSLGCLAVARAWPRIRSRVRAVLFVAPANPRYFGFSAIASYIAVPSMLIASRNDLWLAFEDARRLATLWGSELVDLGPVGQTDQLAAFMVAPLVSAQIGAPSTSLRAEPVLVSLYS